MFDGLWHIWATYLSQIIALSIYTLEVMNVDTTLIGQLVMNYRTFFGTGGG